MALNQEEIRARKRERFKNWYSAKRAAGEDPIGNRARARKRFLIALTDGCQFCGYNKCEDNLAFHHIHDKRFGLTIKRFQMSSKNLVTELRKCVVVCHNCHGEVHRGLIRESEVMTKHAVFRKCLDSAFDQFLKL